MFHCFRHFVFAQTKSVGGSRQPFDFGKLIAKVGNNEFGPNIDVHIVAYVRLFQPVCFVFHFQLCVCVRVFACYFVFGNAFAKR